MNTKCEKCAFKVVENDHQSGCQLGVIDKLLSYNNVYASNSIVNNNGTYIIKNFYCPFARTQEWIDNVLDDDKINRVIKDSHQKYYCLLLTNENNLDNAVSIINTIFTKHLLPHKLSVIYTGNNQKSLALLLQTLKTYKDTAGIIWKLHHISDIETTPSEAIDSALSTALTEESNMIMVFNADQPESELHIENIYDIVNYHLYKPVAVLDYNDKFHNICIPSSLYFSIDKRIGLALEYLNHSEQDIIIYYIK